MNHETSSFNDEDLPLEGIRVLDFSQFLAGPVAAMRLADLGADVIKIERPNMGDACRSLVINDQRVGDDSLLFHTFNRNKRSFLADLKDEKDIVEVRDLIRGSDVLIHNFRPGTMERIGLGSKAAMEINPRLIYGTITGYGDEGPWSNKPGQDLLIQSMSGMTFLSGNADREPIPLGLPVVDIATAGNLVQGILAHLIRRGRTGNGGRVDVDLMSSAIDLQIEHLTAHLNGNGELPSRSQVSNANVYGAAPYGIYRALDGYLAIAMTPLDRLGELLQLPELKVYDQADAFIYRDEIKAIIAENIASFSVSVLLERLESGGIWCAKVMNWLEFINSDGFKALDPLQKITAPGGQELVATRCPIRLDGRVLKAGKGAPALGADTDTIREESV